MKKELDIKVLLQKSEELKALFVLGQRVIPFLEEIFLFIQDTSPLIQEISVSIKDNLKKMPKASKQLSKVTEATEMATNEIMDTVDGVMYKSGIISTNLSLIKEIGSKSDFAENEDFLRAISNSDEVLKSIKNDAQNIMMSLQVQDITSQQIAAVNNLLETLQVKLGSITDRLKNTEFATLIQSGHMETTGVLETKTSNLHRTIAFDPDAVDALTNNTARQQDVDDLLKQMETSPESIMNMTDAAGDTENEEFDANDIDALFASTNGGGQTTTPSADTDEEIDPDDIDALFASTGGDKQNKDEEAADPDEPFSQDDIDALFK